MRQAKVETLVIRYEALRRAALGQECPRGHGLALVIHRGVSAWMLAWGELDASCTRHGTSGAERPGRSALEIPELVQALTSMALGAVRG
jgi:hypothetical protein